MIDESLVIRSLGLPGVTFQQVHGGDISRSFSLLSEGKKYFLKLNSAVEFPGMFVKEAGGLEALSNSCDIPVPGVIRQGIEEPWQYLLLEWLEAGVPVENSWRSFGESLAALHRKPGDHFGWKEDNYIGSLVQLNSARDNWPDFFAEFRLFILVKELFDRQIFSRSETRLAENLARKLHDRMPREQASLLHGDLWSGNYRALPGGKIAVFDPAVYYGHREMDLAMTRLFGGFDPVFYTAYLEGYPLEPAWDKRLRLFQLYPLLVHAILFGGHYIEECRSILRFYQ